MNICSPLSKGFIKAPEPNLLFQLTQYSSPTEDADLSISGHVKRDAKNYFSPLIANQGRHPQAAANDREHPSTLSYALSADQQKKQKQEIRRERNREAAAKCRQRKLDKINHLNAEIAQYSGQNQRLSICVLQLQQEIIELKNCLEEHRRLGCVCELFPSRNHK